VEDQATLAEREALERMSRAEAENVTALASAHGDAEGLVRKIVVLEGELVTERQTWEVSEREHREQFEELTLLETRGFELCPTVVGPPQARHHLFEGMQIAALRHTKMARELAALRAAVSSVVELVHGHSPSNIIHVGVVGELAAEF
jgi:hypothetical protein